MVWAYVSAYAVLAMVLSVAASIGVFMIAFNRRLPIDVALFYALAALGSLAYFLSARDLTISVRAILDVAPETWAGRVANVLSLGLCLAALVQTAINGPVSRAGVFIVMATLQYYFICFLMPASFDRWFEFDHKLLYPIAALIIVVKPSGQPLKDLGTHFARAASIPAILSAVLMAYNYNAAVLTPYEGLLPFFQARAYGATSHPNVLGTTCTFALLLIAAFPPRRRREALALIAINLVMLLLCQSKTSWLICILTQAIFHIPRFRGFSGRIPPFVYVVVFVIAGAVPALMTLFDRSIYDFWAGNQTARDFSTLTGRTDIWQATLFLVKQHLVTGPGYASYLVYMQSLFPNLVANPHNLYLATMVQAGVIGLAALAIYLITLIIVASSLRGQERLFGLAFILLIVVRGMSESFTFQTAFTGPAFWALLMFMRLQALMAAERKTASEPAALRLRPA